MITNVQGGHGIVRVMIGMVTVGQGDKAQSLFACSICTRQIQLCQKGPWEKYQGTIRAVLARLRLEDYFRRSIPSNGFYFDDDTNKVLSCQHVPLEATAFLHSELGIHTHRSACHDNEAGLHLPEQQSQQPDLWDGVPHGQQLTSVQSNGATA